MFLTLKALYFQREHKSSSPYERMISIHLLDQNLPLSTLPNFEDEVCASSNDEPEFLYSTP